MNLQYPIGPLNPSPTATPRELAAHMKSIHTFAVRMEAIVQRVTEEQLRTPYRDGGWKLYELVHHCADSHLNAFTRFKIVLTEDEPTIRPYDQDAWVDMIDVQPDNVGSSLSILLGLHERWSLVLHNLSESDLQRKWVHPDHDGTQNMVSLLGMYGWHCEHHLAQAHAVLTIC